METVSSKYHFSAQQIANEQELIGQAQLDPKKFSVLYDHYHEQIFLFVLKRMENEERAADVTSQVFLKALSNLKKYQPQGVPFASWLYRIARNEIINDYEKNKTGKVISVESEGVWDMITEFGDEKKEEDFTRLYAALNKLTDEDLEMIELRFFEKRAFKEIGEILEITENNAKVKTYRILDKLKNLLKHER